MVKRGSFCGSCCLLVMISVGIGLCQDQEIDVRAKRYYTLLEKRPGSVQLFDRFYDAWLDTSTLEALEEYLNSQLATNPNVTHHLVLASFFERQGKHVESLRLYREAAERDPENGEVLYLKAQAELRTLDFDSAISDLERARTLQLSGDLSEKCAKLLGKLYVRTTQNDKAQAVWQQLLQDNPQDEDLYEDLIELQLAEGLYEGAIATSDQLLAITKDSYEKVMRKLRRGDILQYSGKNEEALTAYASCLSLVGNGTWLEDQITAQIERVFRREDNLSGLREYYAKLIKADAQRLGLRTRLARLLLQMNRHDEALAIYQEILKVTPGDKDNQKAYVAALSKARQFGKAIDLLTQMHQQHANDRELLIQLAELYQQNKQGEQAAQALETFVTQSEKTEYLFLRAGRILERYELADQAEGLYQQLAETFPESLGAKEAYAQFLLRAEKTEAALSLWQEIAHAGDVAMLVRAAQTVSRHNHREQALEWLESQYASYSDDMTYLATLCQIGQRLKQYDKALVWARRQLEISERFSRIKSAVAQVVAVAKRGKQTTDLIDELAAQGTRSIQQTCLLAELYDSVYMSTEADALLAQVGKDHQEMALKQQIRLCRLRRDWSLAAQKTEALLAQTGTRDSLYVRELV
ncbi:MAG: tetratricopeptide repeat protein, partial [Planctomycetes bacterium]|nr:tetratricopeptide repeat protein [Planctomycetota bacterium]